MGKLKSTFNTFLGVSALTLAIVTAHLSLCAESVNVPRLRYAGAFIVNTPYMLDSIDNNDKKFDSKGLLESSLNLSLAENAKWLEDSIVSTPKENALHLLGFTLNNPSYLKGAVKVEGIENFKVFADGKELVNSLLDLSPGQRFFSIKFVSTKEGNDTIKVSIEGENLSGLKFDNEGKRPYTMDDIFTGIFLGNAGLSPSGKYLMSGTYFKNDSGETDFNTYYITDIRSGKIIRNLSQEMSWMPKSDLLYFTRTRNGITELVTLDPVSGIESVKSPDFPSTTPVISPDEKFAVYYKTINGPKEKDANVYEVLNPEDRQPGWRDRHQLMKFDFASGLSSQLTFGRNSSYLCGISDSGDFLLFMTTDLKLGTRPTTVSSLYLLDLRTMEADLLIDKDGFMANALLSPDGKRVALIGSPEAFGGVGNILPDGVIPSAYDYQLYVMNIATKDITPLTRDFDPAILKMAWSGIDNKIYFTAQHRDMQPLYRVNPDNGKIENLNVEEDYIMSFGLADKAPVGFYKGESPDTSYRLYTFDTRTLKSTLIEDLNDDRTKGIALGQTYKWEYQNAEGDTLYASYNLPPDFDPEKKYPMIVYYYGGCSPTGRYLDATYNPHLYAANGYIALVINPRGAAGFGQEYSSKHVATAGQGIAEDIITGVQKFTEEHPWVNSEKIGCLGASYGGFMTQYLQTQTDLFAAAISHAGISDHTSYWGNGYWGYSYSEVSMGDKYPWSDRELYVNQSPLYNADKIHTPLLLLHGNQDTNVPYGESVQLFTALKLLGREVALVGINGENHFVLDLTKRRKWIDTMFAWFAKYLKDDPSWWEALYPAKSINP